MSEAEKVNKKSQDLTHEEYIQAADYWKQKDAQAVKMDREKKWKLIFRRITPVHL